MLIGIDVGGTTTKVGLFDDDFQMVDKKTIATERKFEDGIENIAKLISEYRTKYTLSSVGVGLTGIVEPSVGELVLSFSLPDWSGKNIVREISDRVGLPVRIENDAVCAAVAEIVSGVGRNSNELICLIWGTGVGGTMIKRIDKKLIVFPVEIGSQIIEWGGEKLGHGPRGRLSNYVGGGTFELVYGIGPEKLSADDVIWNKVSQRMAQGVINTLVHFKSEVVVFSGGFINKQAHLLDKIKKNISERLAINKVPELRLSQYGESGGMYGAAMLPLQDLSR